MEFKEVKLNEAIDGILGVAKNSFEEFYDKEKILKRLKDKKYWVYVAEDEGKIVGFKIWYEYSPKKIYSWLGAVHPAYRRKRIATKLMEIQLNHAKKLGYRVVEVKTHQGHPEMLAFLKKEGYKKTKVDLNHWGLGKDAIFFEKII